MTLVVLILSHELAHFIVSKTFGYSPALSYDHTDFGFPKASNSAGIIYHVPIYHQIWILAAGPLLTMIIGSVGMLLLFIYRTPERRNELLTKREWLLVLIASFWVRQMINGIIWFFRIGFSYKISLRSDEMKISGLLDWPLWSIFIPSAVLAAIIFGVLILKFIPLNYRLSYLLAVLTGGIMVELLWLQWVGPVVLP